MPTVPYSDLAITLPGSERVAAIQAPTLDVGEGITVRFGFALADLAVDWMPGCYETRARIAIMERHSGHAESLIFSQTHPSGLPVVEGIRRALLKFAAHEVDESIRQHGALIFDPHSHLPGVSPL